MQSNYLKSQFLLKEGITYLNFGAFGACPKPVFERYQQYQLELEQEPTQFITVNGLQYLRQSREALAAFLNCNSDDVVYVTNPSYGVNIVAKSFPLKEGDEVLTSNLEYGACDRTWSYYCEKKGAKYVRQEIKFPIQSKEDFIEQFLNGLTSKTRIVFLSHITSSTGLRLPIEEICAIAKQKGLITFVDGAHAPGQLPINLGTLNVDFYTGACHKWMLTPKGSSFLYVKKELQNLCDPLLISWGYKSARPSHSQFLDYHQLQGTRDFSAFLTVPAAIGFMKENNWSEVAQNCRAIAMSNADRFRDLLKTEPLHNSKGDFIFQMCSTLIKTKQPEQLHQLLFVKYNIEIPVMQHNNMTLLRYSIQAFNSQQDLDILYNALEDIIKTTNLVDL
ncbi:aminotransferase class V-fold PLP-dependent enzyme [Ginsengibacter hankyongi]|uniref:Aminotransferase class V-fold PLP-dependent enzyme n=1 Tax=Ginsengibacter hankyongi TaxID=2607284 RepID=A0A5J5IEX6_9BACT|nr:aminotransferase class V-fold PLP-dependent enzyme [Ginsengibacter hankyongi]KAA9037575.1 aminotransferase class V-fold PLP-dependent enzyme [Ginsengibacter hankyongi]